MYYRFAATKENIELGLIKFLQENGKNVILKKGNDYKGISFSFVWERLSNLEFKLICYHKGIFSVTSEEFAQAIDTQPFGVINSVLFKELLSITYTSDPNLKYKDIVFSDVIGFKFVELFEDEETMMHYVVELFGKFGWKLQVCSDIPDADSSLWKDY
jgi:hypothetical protein